METKYKAFTSKRKFGVEFELSNNLDLSELHAVLTKASPDKNVYQHNSWAQTDDNNEYWHIKRDSTCGPEGKTKQIEKYGYEVASYVGKGVKDILHMGKVAEAMKKDGAKINKHCGIHIHASADGLTAEQVGVIMAYWVKIERTMFQSCPPSRRRNKYCRSLRRRVPVRTKLTPIQFWEKIRPGNLNTHENNDKKVSVNTVGFTASQQGCYGVKNTLELRMPEASLEKADIINWIRLYLNFVESTKKAKMPLSRQVANVKDTLQILGLQGVQNFFILSSGLYETKLWFLNRIIQYSTMPTLVKEAKKIVKDISRL
jgi:hypothetical protein